MNSEVKKILGEDARRRAARAEAEQGYDPLAGRGACGPRTLVATPVPGMPRACVPEAMTADAEYAACRHDPLAWQQLRCRHDFEYWCARCVTIKHKTTGCMVPFVLNAPQRRLAALLEADRRARRPMRVIMLKARQWGGSTLVQMYMAWMQCCVRRNWHSLICAHVKDTAAAIRGMYTRMLENYPADIWTEETAPRFSPFERSINTREIAGRGCRVTVGSAENQEAIRGSDYAMAHLSETAFWRDSTRSSPDDFIRAINGAIALVPDTLIVMESTANGVGSYSSRVGFHTNRATKAMIISELIAAVRDGGYIERDNEACNELLTYEQQPSGSYGARRGCHDDILITRALALHAAESLPPPVPEGVRPWRSQWT